MLAVDAVRKPMVTVAAADSIARAAQLMDTNAVGAVVVFDGEQPVGMLTDRDIAVRAVARGIPSDARVDAVMSPGLIALSSGAELRGALSTFHSHAIRRLPLVDDDGHIVGMVTTDDLLIDLIADLGDVVRPITGQVVFGHAEPATLPVPQRSDSDDAR